LALAGVSAQNTPRQVSLVLSGGTVVTMDPGNRVIANGAVAIDGADIVAVDTADSVAKQFRGRETINSTGQIVLPGLINTHTHAAMVLFRGLADDLALSEWLNKYIFPAEAKTVSPEFVRAGDEGGRPSRRARTDCHPVSRCGCQDAGRCAGARRGIHQSLQG
jgi:5-methylthioadenosine/S-adenosylhomocysteine deaminase